MISPTNTKMSTMPAPVSAPLPSLRAYVQRVFPDLVPESMHDHTVMIPGIPTTFHDDRGLYAVAPILWVSTAAPMTDAIAQAAAQVAAGIQLMHHNPDVVVYEKDVWFERLVPLLAQKAPFKYWARTAWRAQWIFVSTQHLRRDWTILATYQNGHLIPGRKTPWLTTSEWKTLYGVHKLVMSPAPATSPVKKAVPQPGWRRHWKDIGGLAFGSVIAASLLAAFAPHWPGYRYVFWTGMAFSVWAFLRPVRFKWLQRHFARRYLLSRSVLSRP
jgi:hypothetical protein